MSDSFFTGDEEYVALPNTPRTPENAIASAIQNDAQAQLMTIPELASQIVRTLHDAGYQITDTLEPAKLFTREEVETAWNAGADMVLGDSDLQLSDSDTDLVNLVCNAISTCLDNPETDDLDTVILACYDPELDEEDADLSDEDADAKRVSIVKGWIDQ